MINYEEGIREGSSVVYEYIPFVLERIWRRIFDSHVPSSARRVGWKSVI